MTVCSLRMSPAVIRGVARLYRDERAATRRAPLPAGPELRLDDGSVISDFDRPGDEVDRPVRRRWAQEFHGVFSRDHRGRGQGVRSPHQVIRGGPVRVAVEQRARDPARQHAGERLMVLFGVPARDDLVAFDDALDPKYLLVARTAAEARAIR